MDKWCDTAVILEFHRSVTIPHSAFVGNKLCSAKPQRLAALQAQSFGARGPPVIGRHHIIWSCCSSAAARLATRQPVVLSYYSAATQLLAELS